MISHAGHGHPLDAEQTANVIIHPLFLLVRVFDNAKPARSSGCLYPGPNPANSARPQISTGLDTRGAAVSASNYALGQRRQGRHDKALTGPGAAVVSELDEALKLDW
jgi:hypothetical protein